jgi:hypothetical protein
MVLELPSHILHFRLLKLYLTNITFTLPAKILIKTFKYYYSYYKHFISLRSVQCKRNDRREHYLIIRHLPQAYTSNPRILANIIVPLYHRVKIKFFFLFPTCSYIIVYVQA